MPGPLLATLAKTIMTGLLAASAMPEPIDSERMPDELAQFFTPPPKYRGDLGKFRSPLLFNDGTPVQKAGDWQRRREEIRSTWHTIMGPWPGLIDRPRVEIVNTTRRENI